MRGDSRAWLKAGVFILSLVPAGGLLFAALAGELGVNPIETIIRTTGDWALRFLLLTLALSPLRRLTGWSGIMSLRRMLGLYAFFYACLHLLGYAVLDQYMDWSAIAADILERPFITVGMLCFLLLVPLAATSTRKMQRRMGGRRWQSLHRLVYVAAVLAVVHFYLMVKADIREPTIYAVVLALLLLLRLPGPASHRA